MSLPSGWHEYRLKEITKRTQLGGNYENAEQNTGTPLIKMGNLSRGTIVLDKVQNLDAGVKPDEQYILKDSDLLFNTRNTLELVGKVAIWRSELPQAVFDLNLMRITFNEAFVFSNAFMNYWFNFGDTIKGLRKLAIGTTSVAAIYQSDLETLKIKLPSIEEQKKIAEILSTWDKAIEQNEKQIAAIRQYQKGMSRAIFEKLDCEELAVTEICRPRQHKTISATDFTETGYPVFGANGFVGFYSEYTHQNESVAVTCRGSTCGTVNFIPPKTYITGNSMAMDDLDTSKVDLRYLYHALIARGLTDIISGSAQPQIVKSAFEVVYIKIPNLEEQMKIAKFLSKLEEMANLASKLGLQIKRQKQGLMQKLLTGKVRVKV